MSKVLCPKHEGAYDCTPFCPICEGNQEYETTQPYTYDSVGWLCDDCGVVPIDEYGCQAFMKNSEPICIDCCKCADHTDEEN